MGHSYTLASRVSAPLLLALGILGGCERGAEPSASLEVAARSVQTGALSWKGDWAVFRLPWR